MIIAVRFGHESFEKAHSSRSVILSTRADMLRSAALRPRFAARLGEALAKDHGTKETKAAQDSVQAVAV